MFMIVGLGNPGKEYHKTRHNAGFEALDILIDEYRFDGPVSKFRAHSGKGVIGGQKVIAVKPMTYMNESGAAVRQIADYYKIDPEREIIVLSDDVDLPVGTVRIRAGGSSGGHRGLQSIIDHLGTDRFIRIRIGVGGAEREKMIGHVLGHFSKEDRAEVEDAMARAAKAAACIVTDGIDRAMNLYNGRTA